MKKSVTVLVLLLLVCSASLLFSSSNADASFYEISMILGNTRTLSNEHVAIISQKALDLSAQQRYLLFESNKKSTTVPFLLNFFVGAGVGSFVQGDTRTGTKALIIDLVALALLGFGYGQAAADIESGRSSLDAGAMLCLVLGGSLSLGSRIGQLLSPFRYAKEQNQKLAHSLNVNFAMGPVVDAHGDLQMRVATGFSF